MHLPFFAQVVELVDTQVSETYSVLFLHVSEVFQVSIQSGKMKVMFLDVS